MIVVRNVFQAKWGKAQQLVDAFVKSMEGMQNVLGSAPRTRILTDLSGQFFTVVQEVEFESLEEWEKSRAVLFSTPQFQRMMTEAEPFIESGRQEYYTLEKTFGI